MIHWDWILTATLATIAVTLTFFVVALTLDWLHDRWEDLRTRRAIARQTAEARARSLQVEQHIRRGG